MATQAFCRALQADADVVISQPGLRRGAGRCSNARWGGHAYGHDHRMRLCCVPGGRDRIAPSVERAGAVAPTTKQSRMRTRTSPRSCRGQSDAPREGPMVRILFPPAASLSHRGLRLQQAQKPGVRRECEPGRDQRTGRAGQESARLGPLSLTGIVAVPPGRSQPSTRRAQALAWTHSIRGSLFS